MEQKLLPHLLSCYPIIKTDIIKGKNTLLFDSTGKKFYDFEAGSWSMGLGHSHPRINQVMINQINKLIHVHYLLTEKHSEKLAIKLLNHLGINNGKATFLSSGSEAVELAIRLANLITNGKAISFTSSYLSAFSVPRDMEKWNQIDFTYCFDCPETICKISCAQLSHINFSTVQIFIIESVTSSTVLFPPKKLVECIANELKKTNGLIVANEVTTGFGRTGKWFGYNHYELQPNMIVMGKALGNGYPISAVVMDEKTWRKIEECNFIYAQSHQNDPLGCVVASEVLTIMQEEKIVKKAAEVGDFFYKQLQLLKSKYSCIKNVRGLGLMLAIEFSEDYQSATIANKTLEKGFFIGTSPHFNLVRFFPPLTITRKEVAKLCKALDKTFAEMEST